LLAAAGFATFTLASSVMVMSSAADSSLRRTVTPLRTSV
jgi:hypothetical protein